MKKLFVGLAIACLAYALVMYLVNPFDIKSLHPRSRLWGVDIYRIPAASMVPNLNIGDIILVTTMSKNAERGDIVVFQYPEDPDIVYIKRLIGKGGDEIEYRNKRLFVNGNEAIYSSESEYNEFLSKITETVEDSSRDILWDKRRKSQEFIISVPDGQLFFLGDNRDNSRDSRYWGFVEESKVVGVYKFTF